MVKYPQDNEIKLNGLAEDTVKWQALVLAALNL